jgi:indole-3-glycerol phosphate synthase
MRYSGDLGVDALVEVHTAQELSIALEAGAEVIGVNSRDLDTFSIDAEAAWRLVAEVPAGRIAVAESSVSAPADVSRVAQAGADAVLVGTALSVAEAPEQLLRELALVPRRGR